MVTITWLGEDTEEMPGPSYMLWNGVKFPKDVPVDMDAAEIADELRQHMIRKTSVAGRFFRVSKTKEATHGEKEKEKQIEEQDLADEESKQTYRRQEEQQQKTGYSPTKKPAKKKTAAATGADADTRPGDPT